MTAGDYKREALELVDNYLAGTATRDSVWQWAQEAIVSREWRQLPSDLQDAIHGMWLLHDSEGSWVTSTEDLRRIRDELAK